MIEKANIEDMGNRFDNITGKKFNHLKVIELYGRKISKSGTKQALWKCECDCEKHNVILSTGNDLKSGKVYCCEECKKLEYSQSGLSRTRIGKIWYAMKRRCYEQKSNSYKRYGGRGITICPEWKDEENGLRNFYEWSMKNGYADGLTIDRIKSDGNYEPSNCRWVGRRIQANNRRNTTYIEYDGQKVAICDLARELGIKENTLQTRYQRGDRGDRLIRKTGRYKKKNVFDDK